MGHANSVPASSVIAIQEGILKQNNIYMGPNKLELYTNTFKYSSKLK